MINISIISAPYLKHLLRRIQSIVVWFLLLFLLLYIVASAYLRYVAKIAVNEAILQIENYNSNIRNIHYQYLEFSPLDFFKQQLVLKNVTFYLNNPGVNITLEALTLQKFMSLTQDPLGAFDINFTGAHVDQFTSVYGMITTWLNNPYLYGELGNVPNQLDLNINGSIHYLPQNNNEADLTFTLNNKKMALFTYQLTVAQLKLTSAFFNNMTAFLNTLRTSQILHIHYQAAINYTVTPKEISSIAPGFAVYLQNLGYQNLPLSINGNSDYSAQDTQEVYHFTVAVQDAGSLNLAINYQIVNAPSLFNTAQQLIGTANNNAAPAPDLIQSASISYQDNSLVQRVLQNMAQNSGQTYAATQNVVINTLNNLAQNLNIPQMNNITTQLRLFILNPGLLTLNINPSVPFSLNDVANFFIAQQQRNQMIQQRLLKLTGTSRNKAYATYMVNSLAAYSAFFNRIGLSVSTNPS
jgi:hypothetical protein